MTVRTPRHGYTLIELVLVLAIIVMLAAISYPSLSGMYADLKVQAAADEVRAQCVTARTQAVNEGRAYAFEVMSGGDRSRVAPLDVTGAPAGGEAESRRPIERTLPKGITFGAVEGDPAAGGDSGFTAAVVFLPDGTAREDKDIVLSARGARPLIVRVRALTGVVTVQKYLGEKGQP